MIEIPAKRIYSSRFSPDAVKILRADEEQASMRDRWRSVIAVAEFVHGEHANLRAGLQHVTLAGVREEQVSRRIRDWTGPRRRYLLQPFGINELSCRRLETLQHGRRMQ